MLSPTDRLTQTLSVFIGQGDRVAVVGPAGTYTVTGSFDAWTRPAEVTVGLLANQPNELEVFAHVRRIDQGPNCVYGDYTLSTRADWDGRRLAIVQRRGLLYLPWLWGPPPPPD